MTPVATAAAPARPSAWYAHLYVQVIVAMAIGVAIGAFFPDLGASLKPLGDAFIRLVKMIIGPVIFCTIVTGIAGMSDLKRFGRVGLKALIYFFTFSTLALVLGLIVANVVQPGRGLHIDPTTLDASAVAQYKSRDVVAGEVDFLLHIIPDTAVSAFTSGQILQVLLFSILFGCGLARLGKSGKPLYDFIGHVSAAVFAVMHIIMKAAPIGALGAIAFTIGKYGIGSLANLAGLVASLYLASLFFIVGVLGLVARVAGFSILKLLRYIKSELLLVFGMCASEPAMPLLMEKLERAGVSRPVVGLVVPTGFSFNLDGGNIYITMAALFIAQATDTPLSWSDQIMLLLVAIVSSKGAAGITGSGFITLGATLSVVHSVPLAGMALILGVDRFMSECRGLTNFIGNAVAAIVVARWEGEVDMKRLRYTLDHPAGPPLEARPAGLRAEEIQ